MARKRSDRATRVTVGFAATEGRGIAYARLGSTGGPESLVRVSFRSRPLPALLGRDVGYAALAAIADELLARGVRRVEFRVDDGNLPLDLTERRTLPAPLILPYVALRCALNRFAQTRVVTCADAAARDLSARARAEVCFDIAA